jgi:hypothetical protein
MRSSSTVICSVLAAAVLMVAGPTRAAEPALALGPVAYAGEIPEFFQREVEQTLVSTFAANHETIVELHAESCQRIECLLGPARRANSAAVVLARISRRERDYTIELTAHAVTDGSVLAQISAECSVCGQRELLDMLPAELARLRAKLLEQLASTDLDALELAAPGPAPERRMVGLRVGGALTTTLGIAGVAAGATLIALDGRPHRPTCAPDLLDPNGSCPNVYTTATAGYALLGLAIASFATGTALLIVAQRQRVPGGRVRLTAGGLQLRF